MPLSKHFVENVGYSCVAGNDITQWDDGTSSNNGIEKDLTKCKEECDIHSECAGFVSKHSSGICGFWKRGPLALTQEFGPDRTCYVKMEGILLWNYSSSLTSELIP